MKSIYYYSYIIKEIICSAKDKNKIKKISDAKERREEGFKVVQGVFVRILQKMKVQLKVEGIENIPKDKNVLFIPNHQGNFDIMALLAASPVPISFVSKKEVKKLPIINDWMEILGCVFIERKKGRESIRILNEAFKNIEKNGSFIMFPEGTRSKGKEMGEFKKGGLKTAIKSGIEIVPVTLNNTYQIMEANNNRLRSAKIGVFFHKPLKQAEGEKVDDFVNRIKEVIKSKIE